MTQHDETPTGKTRRVELIRSVFRLKGLPLFRGLNSERLLAISETVTEMEAPAGATLGAEGEEARFVYILVDGEAEALHRGSRIHAYGPGDLLGELSITEAGTHPLTIRTRTKARLLRMSRYDFRELLDVVPELSMNAIGLMTNRLREALDCLRPYQKPG